MESGSPPALHPIKPDGSSKQPFTDARKPSAETLVDAILVSAAAAVSEISSGDGVEDDGANETDCTQEEEDGAEFEEDEELPSDNEEDEVEGGDAGATTSIADAGSAPAFNDHEYLN